jgi:lysophospholipid acyltransferase (LPLAT)-like uncharacterized protein
MIKSVLKNHFMITILGIISGIYITLLARTIRWQKLEGNGLSGQIDPQGGIIASWHCRLIAFPYIHGWRLRPYGLISKSHDGRMISIYCKLNGVRIIQGSSNKGGLHAYIQMRRLLKSDAFIAITPDGPRGPARQATASAIHLAASSGKPIIPFSYSAAPAKRSKSWDRLMIPKWFGRGVYAFGDPIYITSNPSAAEVESARLALEDAINTVTAKVDAAFNYQPDHIPHRYGNAK